MTIYPQNNQIIVAKNTRITFYQINQFGYFARGQKISEFGDLSGILDELQKWAFNNSMTLGKTCTYEVDDDSLIPKTYCFDLVKESKYGTYLLTTWNELEHSAGKISSVNSDSLVGQAEVSVSQIPDGRIPGPIEMIRKECANIKKIMRKQTLVLSEKTAQGHWQHLLSFSGITKPSIPEQESERFKMEVTHTPSSDELEDIFKFWEEKSSVSDRWDDIGFKFKNEPKPAWLSHSLARSKFKLKIKGGEDETVDTNDLLEQLILNWDNILKIIS